MVLPRARRQRGSFSGGQSTGRARCWGLWLLLPCLVGATCETVEAPVPVFARQRTEDRFLVLGSLGSGGSTLATVEEFLPTGTTAFELHFRGGAPSLRAWAPRIDQAFSVAGSSEGAAWNAVIGNDGDVRSQIRFAVPGFSHRVVDATKRPGELTTFVGTAQEGTESPAALWYSLRQNGEVEWAFRTAVTPSDVLRVLPNNQGAGTLVGTLGVSGTQRPYLANIDPAGAVVTAFEFPSAVPAIVSDAEQIADDAVLIVAVMPLPPPDASVVVFNVVPRTGEVRWMTRVSVALGSLQGAQVAPAGDGAVVVVAADGFSRAPLEDTDTLVLWLGAGGVFEDAFLYGSAVADVPLELSGGSESEARALIRVGSTVETQRVTRSAVEGCGRAFPVTINVMRLPETSVALSLPSGMHPLQPTAEVPQATRAFTDPLFVCLP